MKKVTWSSFAFKRGSKTAGNVLGGRTISMDSNFASRTLNDTNTPNIFYVCSTTLAASLAGISLINWKAVIPKRFDLKLIIKYL